MAGNKKLKAAEEEIKSSAEAVSGQESPRHKKLSGFAKGLMIYSAVLIAAALIALGVLYSFLNAYEHSRPLSCVSDYLQSMSENGLSENCLAALDDMDENVQTLQESSAYVEELLPELSYGKSSKLSTPENPAYILSYDKKPVGTVYLQPMDKHPFGFTFWEVVRDEFDFSEISHSHTLAVPADYTVSVNGKVLGEECISDAEAEYESFSGFYEYYDYLPRLVKYEIGSYLGEESLSVKDAQGNELQEDELQESVFLSNCSEEEAQMIDDFAYKFVNRYVAYASNASGDYLSNYMRCTEMTIPGSQLYNRIGQAIGSFGYSVLRSCEVVEYNLNFCSRQGDLYFADVNYITETVSRKGPVQEQNNIRLAMFQTDMGLLAEIMFNY